MYLDGVGRVKGHRVDHQFDRFLEFSLVAHDGQRVQDVDEGQGVIAQDVIDVDVRRIVVIWPAS